MLNKRIFNILLAARPLRLAEFVAGTKETKNTTYRFAPSVLPSLPGTFDGGSRVIISRAHRILVRTKFTW